MQSRTLYDKVWDDHVVHTNNDGTSLIYIDRHLVHEVTSPQAFDGLRLAKRMPWRIDSILAVADHNVPTTSIDQVDDPISQAQLEALDENCAEYGITEYKMGSANQGIVHVIGPEQGATQPGMTVVCGDSHTSTHGAFAALAFGIGTSEVEHVLATQCLVLRKSKNMRVNASNALKPGVTAKDLILAIIGQIGTDGGTGYTIEYAGEAIHALSMENRMTVCNMSIEAGARAGMIAADEKTIAYFETRPYAPKGVQWEQAVAYWKTLQSDQGAKFDNEIDIDAAQIKPQVTWGTSPEMVTSVDSNVPQPKNTTEEKALAYMDLKPGTPITEIKLDRIFIGSCTNSRIEDLRAAAEIVRDKKVAGSIKQALVVPGSRPVKIQAEKEGLAKTFTDAGFEWREPGCSMCLAMNADRILPGERCASTSNRNYEGRQGRNGRTHLVSPIMAAAAAIKGHFVDVRDLL